MKVLSIIIPAYNSERFLDKCIMSMLNEQVLDKLDIVVVNDGSKDGTAQVAQKYCDLYPRSVRMISQENKGHGGALNTGCNAAVGKYLKVIDADDWVETDNLPQFIEALKNINSDVVLTHHYTIDISSGEIKKWMSYPEKFGKPYTFDHIIANWKSFDRSLTFHGITYRTEFYKKHGVPLSEHVFYEDHEYATMACCYSVSVTPLDIFIYDYRIGDVTQSVSNANQLKRITHTETVLKRFIQEYSRLTLPEGSAGRSYFQMKAQGLLLSYLATAMLVNPDRKSGRNLGRKMMKQFKQHMPETYTLARKQYAAFWIMNRIHINKEIFEKILHSRAYNKIRKNRNFD